MKIGISCYASVGGSGIVATEIGNALAARGHRVFFICAERPFRFDASAKNPSFERVAVNGYPPLQQDLSVLSLAAKMAEVAAREALDVLHVHYAVPHATAAFLAKQILGSAAPLKVVTTLHGTDITLVGADPVLLPITRFSIEASDAVTAVSRSLAEETKKTISDVPIDVIANFVDTARYAPGPASLRQPMVVHHSNFRALKRVDDVVRVFAAVRAQRECELVLIGDGPERLAIEAMVGALGLTASVRFLGERLDFADVLQRASVGLFPSALESFGLAALEAMSAGVPIVATRVGGLPEVVGDGGVICDLGDVGAMATAVMHMLDDAAYREGLAAQARRIAVEVFPRERIIGEYEAIYRRVIRACP